MSAKDAYCGDLEQCLAQWNRHLQRLEASAEKTGGVGNLADIKRMAAQMKDKLAEILQADDHSWHDLRHEAEQIRKRWSRVGIPHLTLQVAFPR